MKLSVVSPIYKADTIIDRLVEEITVSIQQITNSFEIILVEDGSPDNSWEFIQSNCNKDNRVKGIKLSRNFGQHYAITAGIQQSTGDYVIVMDCDLQDDPKYFKAMFDCAQKGFDIVYTEKSKRKHSIFKNFSASLFNFIFNILVDNDTFKGRNNVGSFSLVSRKAVNAYLGLGDYRRHYLMVLRWLGFKHCYIQVEHNSRLSGKSSYTFGKLLKHALDGITYQSDKLLKLVLTVGLGILSLSFLTSVLIILKYLLIGPFQTGWASLFVLILVMGGLTILSIGVCGIYIGKMFDQVKNRPMYLIDKTLNF